MRDEVVLATIGSLGDVHPLIAVGQALQERGVPTRMGVPRDNLGKVRAAGLLAEAIFPGQDQICTDLSMEPSEVASRLIHDKDFMLRDVVLGYLRHCVEHLEATAARARAIVGPTLSPAGSIVAEKLGIPFIPVAFQPMVLLSIHDPPRDPSFPVLVGTPQSVVGRSWNRLCLSLLKSWLRRKYLKQINDLRSLHDLPSTTQSPVFGLKGDEPLVLGLYSSLLVRERSSSSVNTVTTGFPLFDADEPREALAVESEEGQRLETFLSNGSAPIVFTLGSLAVHAKTDFFDVSLAAARELKMRSIMLTGSSEVSFDGDDTFSMRYFPHSKVFPRAAIIVHHGGIGTTGQALLAGKPQVVVPHFADQFDNAFRLARLGVAKTVHARRYNVQSAVALVAGTNTSQVREFARKAQQVVMTENSSETAATAIINFLKLEKSALGEA
ncbi:MAG: glycosyltransferase [Hyphomicrobiaceae bacterium]